MKTSTAWARRWAPAWALAALVVGGPSVAAAEVDVADWALPDAIAALTFRGADSLADRLDGLEARFGAAPAVGAAAADLRGWRAEGVGPWARAWGEGLDLGAGIGVFADAGQRVRLVIGSTDAAKARASLAAWFTRLEVPLVATEDGFQGPVSVRCAQRGRFLVCDSQQVPEKPAGGDLSLAGAWLAARVSGPLLATLPPPMGLWAEHVELRVESGAADVGIALTLKTREDARPQLDPLKAMALPDEGTSPLGPLHRRSPMVLKFSVDGAAFMQALAPSRPEEQALAKRIGQAWSGEVLATFVGGLGDPIVAFGLQPEGDGRALVEGLIELLAEGEIALKHTPGKGDDGALSMALPDDSGTLTLPYRITETHLIVGLEAIDLARAAEADPAPPGMPAIFGKRGVQGVFVAHLPNGVGAFPRFIDFADADARFVSALTTIAQLEAKLLDSAALWIAPGPDTVTVELRWSRL